MRHAALGCQPAATALVVCTVIAGAAAAQDTPSLNFYGTVGGIDMPSGLAMPDGRVAFSFAQFGPNTRNAFSFQFAPRLSGSFRYAAVRNYDDVVADSGFDTYYDRSFDLRYQLLTEGRYVPAVTIGLQDFAGTGLFGAEYIAATKHILPNLTVTGGLGWGRLGTYNSFGSAERPDADVDRGGKPNWDTWFRGPAAPFAGVEWLVNDRLGVKVEYSSDAYEEEAEKRQTFDRSTPFNFGVEYQVTDSFRLGAYSLYGSEVGVSAQFILNPKVRPSPGIGGPAPVPVIVRPSRGANPQAWSGDWASVPDNGPVLRDAISAALQADGIRLDNLTLSANRAEARIINFRFDAVAQSVGRTARVLAAALPPSVEVFDIVLLSAGLPVSTVSIKRSDLEQLEFVPDAAAQLLARSQIGPAGPVPADALGLADPGARFSWSVEPFLRWMVFDPQDPFRADLRLRARATYELASGLYLNGSVTQKIAGNLADYDRESNSVLPHVRTDGYLYDDFGNPELERLTLAWYSRLGENLYGRVTAGYLERMFGGVSTEVLWAPVDSPLALGAELNYARQRSFETDLTFQDYDNVNGSVSAYYDFENGFLGQIDVGSYLAGDYGATFTLERAFANGWRVGAFATFTNVSAEDFGEGSFDKGIYVEIPLNWALSVPTRDSLATTIRPITRDGGAVLEVDGRLYETVRDYHTNAIESQWSRVWR